MTGLVMLQTGIFSRLTLLQGSADIVLLVIVAWSIQERVKTAWQWTFIGGLLVSLVTAVPFFAPLIGYGLTTFVARLILKRIWQTPIMAMLGTTFVGTMLYHLISLGILIANGSPLPVLESLTQVTLPSAMLNLLFSLPVYTVITDLAKWVYPEESV